MKITNYHIQQSSAHSLTKEKSVSEKRDVWNTSQQEDGERAFILDLKSRGYQLTSQKTYLDTEKTDEQDSQDTRIKLIESLIFQMTGKRIKFRNRAAELLNNSSEEDAGGTLSVQGINGGWGLSYEYQEVVSEQENVRFDSGGYVQTADGRRISFNMTFSMSRSFYQQTNVNIRLGAKKVDPLVVVFGGGTPTLSAHKQAFDINADGIKEKIAFATGNSGFLALDKNTDGVINDGSELFGPQSGNGFTELAAYDTDKNGWIDESDEVFGRLSVLTISQDGETTLFKLGDVGIGAIYLHDISTQFSVKEGAEEYGEMKSSSVFLKEDGTVGTVHHIDLAL